MDIPTSRAQTSTPPPLEDCLSQLAAGTFAYGHLASFSDLSREQARSVERAWPGIEHTVRRRLIAAAVDLCEENVEYQFGRLFRIGLADVEPDIRQIAIAGLWEDDSRSLLRDLMQVVLEDRSDDVRASALRHLGDAIPRLIEEDSDGDLLERISDLVLATAGDEGASALVRRRAIEAVGGLEPSEETQDVIQEAWEHGDQALEASALVAMGRSMESRWLPIVRSALGSEDAEIRFEAARALASLGTSDDVPSLAERTLDEDADIRRAAISALGEIGGPGAVRVLRNLAREADEVDQALIDEALDAALLMNDPFRMAT